MTNPPARTPFRLFAAGLALTAFLAAGCGVDGKDDASSDGSTPVVDVGVDTSDDSPATTAEPTDDTSDDTSDGGSITTEPTDDTSDDMTDDMTDDGSGDGSIPSDVKDQIVGLYVDMGLSEDQAGCLADKFLDAGGTEVDTSDMSKIMDWFGECDISMSDLSKIGAGG